MSIIDNYPDLQKYQRVHHRRHKTDKLIVSIYKQIGSINLSESSYIALKQPNYLVLYYSQEKHTLLLQRAIQGDSGAIQVRQRERTHIYYVNVKQFCQHIGIDLLRLHRYEAQLQDDVLLVYLNEEKHETPKTLSQSRA